MIEEKRLKELIKNNKKIFIKNNVIDQINEITCKYCGKTKNINTYKDKIEKASVDSITIYKKEIYVCVLLAFKAFGKEFKRVLQKDCFETDAEAQAEYDKRIKGDVAG